ncbi:gephyrin-like molybdotransferase Glp [Adlercreutzia sp. ZJ154]|uniref:molybdopterin molybdotransferase MoeA n=1 Tax=Adlercreutzia sp. ZJ154 TaxID=2709790 RepID=UPI0013EB1DB2|nr:gephyrin-like molybdotransferase Glp [Adlercreutzia sp. ZJ154]
MSKDEMISLSEARELVLSRIGDMPVETVGLLDAVGRVATEDLRSDIDVSPFAHSAMDGFAVHASDLTDASADAPVQLKVIGDIGAGDVFQDAIGFGECIRIMTGAELPSDVDAVVKYEIVDVVEGDGKRGSIVSFTQPTAAGSNVRQAGEEARAGQVVVQAGEVLGTAGAGFLASCGVLKVPVRKRPTVGIMATGSELVPPDTVPGAGHIRESNSFALAACAKAAGAIPTILPIVADTYEGLRNAVVQASTQFDFVITTGGAANGDYDFIKQVVEDTGELLMTLVNMRPGKAQTFGLVNGTPVFGLPGNPAAAYCGFEMIIRPALRKMQGYCHFDHPRVRASLTKDVKKKDPRMILLRSVLTVTDDGTYKVTPATNQSSGSFGVIQKTNCLSVMPAGLESKKAGDILECILLDIPEEVAL